VSLLNITNNYEVVIIKCPFSLSSVCRFIPATWGVGVELWPSNWNPG